MKLEVGRHRDALRFEDAVLSGKIVAIIFGATLNFFLAWTSTTWASSATTIVLIGSRIAFRKLSTWGREVGRMWPVMASAVLRFDHDAGTGNSTSNSMRTGTSIGCRPAIAICAASRPCASYFRVAAGV